VPFFAPSKKIKKNEEFFSIFNPPTIWIDGDACPAPVKEIIYRAAIKQNIPVTLVANKWQAMPRGALFSLIIVATKPDEADEFIVEKVQEHDLVITSDLPLASLVLQKKANAISPYGEHFSEKNMGERLSLRAVFQMKRESGDISYKKGNPFSEKEKQAFASLFDKILFRSISLKKTSQT
jgi:uncharacterized protein YaiI (UPF0178 family)